MKILKYILLLISILACTDSNKVEKKGLTLIGLSNDANIKISDIHPVSFIDSIPQDLFLIKNEVIDFHYWYLQGKLNLKVPFLDISKNILLIRDEDNNEISGKYFYSGIEKILNEIENSKLEKSYSIYDTIKPKGFISIGFNDLKKYTNYKESIEKDKEFNNYYKEYELIEIDTYPYLKSNIKMPEPIDFIIDYKFLIVFLHEVAHHFQHNIMIGNFLMLNEIENYEKKFILELNADYIVGVFYAQLVYQQLFEEYRDKKNNISANKKNLINFDGIDKKYKISVSLRQTRSKKTEMFKKIGEAIFIEMLNFGDFEFGLEKHHGTNADRATAFYNGYVAALQEPYFTGTYHTELILKDLEVRIINYNKSSEAWK